MRASLQEERVTYRSVFIFDGGSDWATDWSQSDFAMRRPRALFTRLDLAASDSAVGRWRGRGNILSIVRDEHEQLQDLHRIFNSAPLGGPRGSITQRLVEEAEAASHRLPPLVNVYY